MRLLSLILTVLVSFEVFAQNNLVVNGSFEDTLVCPSNNSIIKTKSWFTPTCGSPDYFYPTVPGNIGCAEQWPQSWGGGSFSNNWGFQQPHSGVAYVGAAVAQGQEMFAGKLNDSLILGKTYVVSFYASLGEMNYNQGKSIDLVALDFMRDSITDYTVNCWQYLGNLEVDATNQSGNFLNDTLNWMLVTDTFIAEGGERYFVLANIDTLNTQYSNNNPGGCCYYYFDDFDVHCIDCTSDTSEPPVFPVITITPTLTQGEITLSGDFPAGTKLEVYDVLGQLVYYDELQSGNQTQTVFLQLSAGVYTCRVIADGNVLKTEKVVVGK